MERIENSKLSFEIKYPLILRNKESWLTNLVARNNQEKVLHF